MRSAFCCFGSESWIARALFTRAIGSLNLDCHTHPGMDAALKMVLTFRQTGDLHLAALNDSSLGNLDFREAADTFGDCLLSRIEPPYKAATKLLYLGEGVRLAALIGHDKSGSFFDLERVRFEVPARVRSSSGCFCKQVGQGSGESKRAKRDVLAEVRPKRGIESERIAFVQRDDWCET